MNFKNQRTGDRGPTSAKATARQAEIRVQGSASGNESVAIFLLCSVAAGRGANDRAVGKFLAQYRVDVARLDSGNHSRLSGGKRLSRRTTRSALRRCSLNRQ